MIYWGKSCHACGVVKRKRFLHRVVRYVERSPPSGAGLAVTCRYMYWYCDEHNPAYNVIRDSFGMDVRYFKLVPNERRVNEDGTPH